MSVAHVSLRPSLAEGGVVGFAERDVHGLLVGVEVDRAVAALVAEAGGLHAAERGAEVAHVVRVEPHHAGLDRLREVVRALQVARPDVGGEAVLRVVRQRERLFVGVERGDRDDRAEDLLLEDAGVGGDVGEHGRGDEVAGVEALGPAAAGDEAALGLADLDVAHHLVVVLGVHERADLGRRVVRVADDHARGLRGVALDELVVDVALHEDAAAGGAALAVEREDAEDRRVDRGLEVGVGEDDRGRLAAELHRQALEERRRVAEDELSGASSRR